MNNLISTYRLQFNSDFTLSKFKNYISYLQKLGIKTIYASPLFEALPGSTHGYDGLNPNHINPELGRIDQLKSISQSLRNQGMYWLQDIVPNHMAFHPSNPWLRDILEKGRFSKYASYFDVAWNSRLFHGKLMVPVLADSLDKTLEEDLFKLEIALHAIQLIYQDMSFPLNAETYSYLLRDLPTDENQLLAGFLSQMNDVLREQTPLDFSLKWDELKLQFTALLQHPPSRELLQKRLSVINSNKDELRHILKCQYYSLAHWKETEQVINFRRFFTINGLICMNIQDPEVFSTYHALINTLLAEDVFKGVRVDHVDGLYDPTEYLGRLRETIGKDKAIFVEKILEEGEELPGNWPIEGTTGYDFLALVNNLLCFQPSAEIFTDFYQRLSGDSRPCELQLLEKKAKILYDYMGGELENLSLLFGELQLYDPQTEVPYTELREVIARFLIHCPTYRYYGNELPFMQEEHLALEKLFGKLRQTYPELSRGINLLSQVLLEKTLEGDPDFNTRALEFYQRCMQFTGPLMAKGGEDTLMYTYYRFIGHNEVGDSPSRFGISAAEFHNSMESRQKNWPLSLNTTSTHDTKRGEDVRARLNVLTEFADEWVTLVRSWQQMNLKLRAQCEGPDSNDEYMIYQLLLGVFPLGGSPDTSFFERIEEYIQKASREAKIHSTWEKPDKAYEQGTVQFVRSILTEGSSFLSDFLPFCQKIANYGLVNSLAQLTLKMTCPGVPDIYQGGELWDFSLVDPDNRRPVDYQKRMKFLQEMEDTPPSLNHLWLERENGKIKLWLTTRLLALRQKYPDLFHYGAYNALEVQGALKENILAFSRSYREDILLVIIPLHTAALCERQQTDLFNLDWQDTCIYLPQHVGSEWERVLQEQKECIEHFVVPAALFTECPVAILKGTKKGNERSAGLLLSVSSLPSRFGIGDLGPAAYSFVDFLKRSEQRVWQLLPLNPVEEAQGYSPYSSPSSRAGNPLFISPELLVQEGLLQESDLDAAAFPPSDQADYPNAARHKTTLLAKACATFFTDPGAELEEDFRQFCEANQEWLPDYALYVVIKEQQNGLPWYQWPAALKERDENTLMLLAASESDRIRLAKWIQYVVDKQWKSLRNYCNREGIKMIGDIPFYVSYDSSDVWSHRELFLLGTEGQLLGVAGVPPDSFSEKGQLWGMPVFNWEVIRENGYRWWIDRLKKNIELFDQVRLDHFRAFADYWTVPGGRETAEHGEWKTGPGNDFFEAAQKELGALPFIVEDLGKVSPAVIRLKNELGLPGMKILQYAFDDHMADSDFIPHNYTRDCVVYTGTHDNNTVRGWFKEKVDQATRTRMEAYLNQTVNEKSINEVMARAAYSSVASLVILPVQDVLDLDESAKMNLPGTHSGNWRWRLIPDQLTAKEEEMLRTWTKLYGRN